MNKYYVSQCQNGKTITFGDIWANNSQEAVEEVCHKLKTFYPRYNHKVPFRVKPYGEKAQEVMLYE
jgi:hypothetical protein